MYASLPAIECVEHLDLTKACSIKMLCKEQKQPTGRLRMPC